MKRTELTIKNYRCFEDGYPARITLENGIISFVGANNAGKSSLLKMFRELKPLWQQLAQEQSLVHSILGKGGFGLTLDFVNDQSEIFCDRNNRPLSIEFDMKNAGQTAAETDEIIPCRAVLEIKRNLSVQLTIFESSENVSLKEMYLGLAETGRGLMTVVDKKTYDKTINLSLFRELFSKLANCLYIGPFRNALNVGAGEYYDIQVGQSFIDIWHQWQTGHAKKQNLAITNVTESIRHIFGFESLSITASQQLKTLQVNVNNRPYKLTEMGAGLAQFIVVFGNSLINQPALLLIDEPELNLHPSLQIDFVTSLAKYASETTIMATHSIGLARSVSDSIYSFRNNSQSTQVNKFERTINYSEFLGEMSFSAYQEMGFDTLLLVEGQTEIKTIQQFLRMLNLDHKVVIVPLGGDSLARGNVEIELAEFNRLSKHVVAIVDSERNSKDGEPSKNRIAFKASCDRLGYKVLLTERKATENYFTDAAIKAAVGERFSALGHYDEPQAKQEHSWGKANNWRIAGNMVWADIADTDLGTFLKSIVPNS